MKIVKADNYKMARELASVYVENGYEAYTDNKSAVLVYESDKPYGGEMVLTTGSMEVSIGILAEIARIIGGSNE